MPSITELLTLLLIKLVGGTNTLRSSCNYGSPICLAPKLTDPLGG